MPTASICWAISLLVAPVFSSDGAVEYYLPAGKWTNVLSGQMVEGSRWVREVHGYLSLPLMARPNSVIAVGANEDRPDYDYAKGVVFHVFELQDGVTAQTHVPTTRGDRAMTLQVRRVGQQLDVQAEGALASWSVLLRGIGSVQSVDGGTARADELGTLLIPDRGATHMVARL